MAARLRIIAGVAIVALTLSAELPIVIADLERSIELIGSKFSVLSNGPAPAIYCVWLFEVSRYLVHVSPAYWE